MFEQQMKRNKLFDSGLSLAEERKALLYAMLQRLQQLRALIYYHIYSMCGHQKFNNVDLVVVSDERKYLEEYNRLKEAKE